MLSFVFIALPSSCRIYDERQQLNQQLLAQLTDNAAAVDFVDCLAQKQEYVTPHSRANIVHAERHQEAPEDPVLHLLPVKAEEQAAHVHTDAAQDQLPTLIDKLEKNLARELRHVSEQDYITLTKMLKPVQVSVSLAPVCLVAPLCDGCFCANKHILLT